MVQNPAYQKEQDRNRTRHLCLHILYCLDSAFQAYFSKKLVYIGTMVPLGSSKFLLYTLWSHLNSVRATYYIFNWCARLSIFFNNRLLLETFTYLSKFDCKYYFFVWISLFLFGYCLKAVLFFSSSSLIYLDFSRMDQWRYLNKSS